MLIPAALAMLQRASEDAVEVTLVLFGQEALEGPTQAALGGARIRRGRVFCAGPVVPVVP